jgi:hypothetical protein
MLTWVLYTISGFVRVVPPGQLSATLQFIRILRSADCLQPHDTLQFLRFLALQRRAVDHLSIAEYLQSEGYSSRFWDDYLIVSFCSYLVSYLSFVLALFV